MPRSVARSVALALGVALLAVALAAPLGVSGAGWSYPTQVLSQFRSRHTACALANSTVFFAGGWYGIPVANVDVYNATSGAWSTASLPGGGRWNLASACVNHPVTGAGFCLFGGGQTSTAAQVATVDTYTAATRVWSTATSLTVARANLAAVALGKYVLFAGGSNAAVTTFYNTVDLYDVTGPSWSTARLSWPRGQLAGVACGNVALFAGGRNTTAASLVVDLFDRSTALWSVGALAVPRYSLVGACASDYLAVFAGGVDRAGLASSAVDMYDTRTKTWSSTALTSSARTLMASVGVGSQVLFIGGQSNIASTSSYIGVDTYDTATGAWTSLNALATARWSAAAAAVGNKVIVAGGEYITDGSTFLSSRMEVYDYATPLCNAALCQNGATCTEYLTSFTCTCAAGFTGRLCDINIDECASNPCLRGAACTDAVNGYTCDCPTGYLRPNCLAVGEFGPQRSLQVARFYIASACNGGTDGKQFIFALGQIQSGAASGMAERFTVSADGMNPMPTYQYSTLTTVRFAGAGTTAGTKAVIAGGLSGSLAYATANVFDFQSSIWTETTPLGAPRYLLSATTVGDLAIFAGGIGSGAAWAMADIYNAAAVPPTWTSNSGALSVARGAVAACTVNGTIGVFAGGFPVGTGAYTTVDVYYGANNSWVASPGGFALSVARSQASCTAVGMKVFVGGGQLADQATSVATVDIFDFATMTRTTSSLSAARCVISAVTVGTKAVFAGGYISVGSYISIIDMYDTLTGQWQTTSLSSARFAMGACVYGTTAYFAGGGGSGSSAVLDVLSLSPCASDPCGNGGTCNGVSTISYSCACAVGFTGAQCQTNINECASSPCGPFGTCVDGVGNYTCSCLAGYTGTLCQTNINECASSPCVFGNCVDGINSFQCQCFAGYTGARCQTNANECASNPCANGGTCADGINSFSCTCPTTWTGTVCTTDVDECAVNNGGCGPVGLSVCTNYPGGWNCTVFVQPASLTSPDPVVSASPLVLSTIGGQRLEFGLGAYKTPLSDVAVSLGTSWADWNVYACTGLVAVGAMVGPLQTVRCSVAGVGTAYYVVVSSTRTGLPLAMSTQTVSFPAPTLGAGSLRQNRTGYDPAPTDVLLLDTTLAVKLSFNGTNFYPAGARFSPAQMTVTYGTLASGGTDGTGAAGGSCTIVTAESTETSTTCITTPGSQGADLIFAVTVGGQTVTSAGLFTLSFPLTPVVSRVSGCGVDTGNTTSGCSTPGGDTITVYGINFFQTNLAVSVAGSPCLAPTLVGDAQFGYLTCQTTASQGGVNRPVVVTSNGVSSNPVPWLSFAPPTISQVIGCDPGANPRAVVNCPTTGGSVLTLLGSNFGSADASVLIGASICQSPTQNASRPHWAMTCVTPSGTGEPLAILLLQGGGGIGSNAALSYRACPPGTKVNGLLCDACPNGLYSAVPNAQECQTCLSGTHTSVPSGASECVPCDAGRYSDNTASQCRDCPVGTAVAVSGQGACPLCGPGTFMNVTGAQVCLSCDAGRYQPNSGESTCRECAPGSWSTEGVAACSKCLYGTMAPSSGHTTCLRCPPNSASRADYTLCDCSVDFYATTQDDFMQCEACPVGADCALPGTTWQTMIASDGWWRIDNSSLSFYQCLTSADCVNGGCAAHRDGPICAVCEKGYSMNSIGAACTPCPSHGASVGGTVGYTILIAFGIVVVFYIVWRSEPAKVKTKSPYQYVKAWSREDRVAPNYAYNFKILLSYLQIATTLLNLAEVPWPSAFQQFLEYFSFVNLDFIPWGSVNCVTTLNFYDKLALLFTVPFVVLIFVAAVPYALLYIRNRFDYTDRAATRHERTLSIAKIMRLIVFALFLMYPAISAQVLSFFICRTVNGQSYLVADFTLRCHDDEWNKYLPLAVIAIFVYPVGIPVFLGWQLFRVRRRLRMEVTIVSLGLAYDAYLLRYWWWELADLTTKLFLTSLLGFFPPKAQCAVGMGVVGAYLMALLIAAPYVRHIDDRMSCVVQCHLFLILLSGYVLQQDVFVRGSSADVTASVLMFLVLAALVVLVIVHIIIFTRKYVRNVQRAKAVRDQVSMRSNPLQGGGGESVSRMPSDTNGSGNGSGDGGRPSATDRERERVDWQFNALGMTLDSEVAPVAAGGGSTGPASPRSGSTPRANRYWTPRLGAVPPPPSLSPRSSAVDVAADDSVAGPRDVELTAIGVGEGSVVAAAAAAAESSSSSSSSSRRPPRQGTNTSSIIALADRQNAQFDAHASAIAAAAAAARPVPPPPPPDAGAAADDDFEADAPPPAIPAPELAVLGDDPPPPAADNAADDEVDPPPPAADA